MSKHSKHNLSQAILQMKFMQRTKDKIDLENEAKEGKKMYSKEISEKMLNSKTNFIQEQSFVYCEGLLEAIQKRNPLRNNNFTENVFKQHIFKGRYSFRGMNPEIERILELEAEERAAAKIHEQPTEVSDGEMADFYDSKRKIPLTVTLEKKFQHKKDQIKRHSTKSSKDNKRKKLNPIINEEEQDTVTND